MIREFSIAASRAVALTAITLAAPPFLRVPQPELPRSSEVCGVMAGKQCGGSSLFTVTQVSLFNYL